MPIAPASGLLRPPGPAAARSAYLGHGSLQLPLPLLHAARGLRRGLRSSFPRTEILSFEEIARVARIFAALGVRKLRLTGGEPLLRHGLPSLIAMLAEIPDVDIALTTNGSLLAAQAQALADAGLKRVTVSLDSLDDAVFRSMNDADFPVARVLEGIDAAAAAGLHPIKINAVVRRGINDHTVVDLARHFREHRAHRALHRVHGRRPQQRLAAGRRRAGRGDRPHDRRRDAAGARRRQLRRRGGAALALRRRRRRGRRHHVGHAAVLRRLHARPHLRRGQAVHLPLRRPKARTCAPCCATAATMPRSPQRSRTSGARARIATPSCGRLRRRSCRRSRCRTSAGERVGCLRRTGACPHVPPAGSACR